MWTTLANRVYECRVWLCPEREGGFSALVPSLPGVASQGETEEEALDNVEEAFQGAVAEYLDSGEQIPWRRDIVRQKPHDAKEKWILVNVRSAVPVHKGKIVKKGTLRTLIDDAGITVPQFVAALD